MTPQTGTPWLIHPSFVPQSRPTPFEEQNRIEVALRDRQRSMARPGVRVLLLEGALSPAAIKPALGPPAPPPP